MPWAPKRPCRITLCAGFAERDGYCCKHAAARARDYDHQRGSASARGYGARWRKLRQLVLARDPVCRACRRAPANDIDHITPRRRGGDDTLDNLQGLCAPCHARKTALTDGRWG